jgi:hypothetical protein
MKTVTQTTNIYQYEELSKEAKEKAIQEHIEFLESIDWSNEEYRPSYIQYAIDKCNELRTPWFFKDYILEDGRDLIEQELQDYEFYKEGARYYE